MTARKGNTDVGTYEWIESPERMLRRLDQLSEQVGMEIVGVHANDLRALASLAAVVEQQQERETRYRTFLSNPLFYTTEGDDETDVFEASCWPTEDVERLLSETGSSAAGVDGAVLGTSHHEPVGERQGRQPVSESLPARVVVGANGAYWRDFGDFYSMCPVSTDNHPVEIVAVYALSRSVPPKDHGEIVSAESQIIACAHGKLIGEEHCTECQIAGFCDCPECRDHA